jgi:hypothetical protein
MKLFALPFVGALMIATAASASAATRVAPISGVVVSNQHGLLLIASSRGVVHAFHGQAAIGTRVSVKSGHLASLGSTSRAVVRGVLVRRRGSLSFLSAGGHMLVVHSAHARGLASARDNAPATPAQPGSVVQDTVTIGSQGDLNEQDEQQVGDATQTQIQAVVSAVAAGSVTLTVNGQALTIPLPAGLTLPSSIVGLQVSFNLSFGNGQATVDDNQGDDGSDGENGSSAPGSGQIGAAPNSPGPATIAGPGGGEGLNLAGGNGNGDD